MKAFPSDKFEYDAYGNKQPMGRNEGMDLRDYFAAKAMQATMSNPEGMQFFTKLVNEFSWESAFERLATKSYAMADAMMEARKK